MTHPTFDGLGLAEPLLRALRAEGYDAPTPIQAQAIPPQLAGRDILGIAQTGTGKTAAFALPILQRLAEAGQKPKPKSVRALILAPTRELAVQIDDSFAAYGRNLDLRHTVVVGGVSIGPQRKRLGRGVDILVATPGRLLDLVGQGCVTLDTVSHLVLDEADRMLDMGFIHDVRKIVGLLPRRRRSLLFSATMPKSVERLANDLLTDPVRVEVTPRATTVETVVQQVHHVTTDGKRALLADLMADPALSRVIVFTRTKHRANRVADYLEKAGVNAEAIHGNKSQNARQRALDRFRHGDARVLVATDIAARGIDIDDVSHVINFELPDEPESYVHRIGRTARAGAGGNAISFCDAGERDILRRIERLTGHPLEIVGDPPKQDRGAAQTPSRGRRRPNRPPRRQRPRHAA